MSISNPNVSKKKDGGSGTGPVTVCSSPPAHACICPHRTSGIVLMVNDIVGFVRQWSQLQNAFYVTPAKAVVHNSLTRLDSGFRQHGAEGLLQLANAL
jgi:hypothetical protein